MSKWRMANGRSIKIKDMEDSHLTNSIGMIEREVTAMHRKIIFDAGLAEKGVLDIDRPRKERELLDAIPDPASIYPAYAELVQEQKKRYKVRLDEAVARVKVSGGFGFTERKIRG